MFIKTASIKNYRLFREEFRLTEGTLNIPDGSTEGSGLTILVGENSTGKSSILEALSIPLLSYKADQLTLLDLYDINEKSEIKITSANEFAVKTSTPRASTFQSTGFYFKASIRQQNQTRYLSSTIVHDTSFVPSASESIRPTSPDLRTSVNNPFSGPRFSENDYLFIDKNRTRQIESGTFSSTRFDRLLDDFNFQHLKVNLTKLPNPNEAVKNTLNSADIKNDFLDKAFEQFQNLTSFAADLSFIDNKSPYSKAYITYSDGESSQLPVDRLGSGYQMLLAILCQYHLSLQSGKQLIIFIDEVELHLHYKLQVALAKLLLTISKTAQVIVSTHSAQLLKDLQPNNEHKVNVLIKSQGTLTVNPIERYILPSSSANEASYVAFQLPGVEYFNELYGYLSDLLGKTSIVSLDAEICRDQTMVAWEKPDGSSETLSIHSCIRNKIHHPENTLNDTKFNFIEELPKSIAYLRTRIQGMP